MTQNTEEIADEPNKLYGESSKSFERHLSPKQVADLWGWHESTIRRIFVDEPDVLKLTSGRMRRGRREYITIRIPKSVVDRVHGQRAKLHKS
jgi:hypothetical protein